jgi:oligogalacturonide lyase
MMGGRQWTRRGFVASLAVCAAAGAQKELRSFPSERFPYSDPSTDFPVVRLTSPEHSSFLPAACLRAVSRRGTFLVFASDRTGSPQLMRMSLGSGATYRLTGVASLDPSSPALSPDDRGVYFFDGPVLRHLVFGTLRQREIYRVPDGWARGQGFSVCSAGSNAYVAEQNGVRWRVRAVPLDPRRGGPVTVVEAAATVRDPLPRPRHEDVLYRDADGCLALASGTNGTHRRLPLASGRCGPAFWAAGGGSVLYLNFPSVPGQLNTIREWVAAEDSEHLVASTSQFASFAPNEDASVFVGASASKASPYVVLLLRSPRRELPLCEHRASDPAAVAPVFSPDSQRIFFQSDRHGKPAIYSLDVADLVERTSA